MTPDRHIPSQDLGLDVTSFDDLARKVAEERARREDAARRHEYRTLYHLPEGAAPLQLVKGLRKQESGRNQHHVAFMVSLVEDFHRGHIQSIQENRSPADAINLETDRLGAMVNRLPGETGETTDFVRTFLGRDRPAIILPNTQKEALNAFVIQVRDAYRDFYRLPKITENGNDLSLSAAA